jgi:hypothetical protein
VTAPIQFETPAPVVNGASHGAANETDVPEIVAGVDLARVVDDAVVALRADPELYVRGGALTRVVATDGTTAPTQTIVRSEGAPVMRRCAAPWVRERLSVCARFIGMKSEGRGANKRMVPTPIQPPPWVALHVVDRGTWPGYRPLVGIVTAPTLRRDGSVLQKPGYDQASGLLYVQRGEFPAVDDAPDQESVARAKSLLLEVVDDFDGLDDLGRAVWLSLLLTLVCRDLAEGSVPLFAVDAPTAGSGKGLLARTAHRIAFGIDPAHMSLPADDEEMRKQITTCLLAGDPAVLIDNVSVPLGGDSLDAVITAPSWKVRLLGTMEDSGTLVPRAVWMVTGNGLELVGDMGRRTLRVRLIPKCERPEERTDYKHPERGGVDALLGWVDQHRPQLVHAALTVLRGWVVAGRPSNVATLGSFEGWSKTVASCVQWLGLPDPTSARASRDAMVDSKRSALVTLFAAIRRYQNNSGVTARELVAYAFPPDGACADEELATALGTLIADRARIEQRAVLLGNKLRASRDRILDVELEPGRVTSLRLVSEEGRGGVLRWRVQ